LEQTEEEEPLQLIPLPVSQAYPATHVNELDLEVGDILYLFHYDALEQLYYGDLEGQIGMFDGAKVDALLAIANIQIVCINQPVDARCLVAWLLGLIATLYVK
jgi:hypothetical protein